MTDGNNGVSVHMRVVKGVHGTEGTPDDLALRNVDVQPVSKAADNQVLCTPPFCSHTSHLGQTEARGMRVFKIAS